MGFNYNDPEKKAFSDEQHQANDNFQSCLANQAPHHLGHLSSGGQCRLQKQEKIFIESVKKPKDLSFGVKDPLSLVPSVLVREVSKCMKDGALKRSPFNWRQSQISAMQTLDKILRHVYDCIDGKDLTDDTKLSNLAAAAADIGVYLDAQLHNSLLDDRPSKL